MSYRVDECPRVELNMDEKEIQERKASLEFTTDDERRLQALASELEPFGQEFLTRLYDFIRRFEPTRRLLETACQADQLFETQLDYFTGLTGGDYGPEYFRHRIAVGETHERVGLAPKWYLAAYRYYFKELIPFLFRQRQAEPERFLADIEALTKIIFLDMGLAMDAYHHSTSQRFLAQGRRLKKILEQLPSGVLLVDPCNRIISVNSAACRILGLKENPIGRLVTEVLPIPELTAVMHSARAHQGYQGESLLQLEGRVKRCLAVHATRLAGDAESGETEEILITIEDFTELRRIEAESLRLATSDILTGLSNRQQLMERLAQGIAQAEHNGTRMGVLFLDLDNFKDINDSLGHAAGDELLQQLAARLRDRVRASDTLARFGGDEFVLVVNGIRDRGACERVIHHLLSVFDQPFLLEGRKFRLTGSIGVATYPDDGEDPHSLLKYADAAMYRAKSLRGTPYCFFSHTDHRQSSDRLDLEQALRQAVEEEGFHLNYQPIVSLQDQRIAGFEALLRWHHPELGNIPPSRFIPLLEQSGLIRSVGDWILQQVCRQASRHPQWQFAVNVASQQFGDPDFARRLFLLLADHELTAEQIEIELTESTLLDRTSATIHNLNAVADLGVSLAIDDFGTGYSSLSYLRRFPISRIKIDRSFISDITRSEEAASLALGIIQLGRTLRMELTAEGIEAADQLELLRHWHCDAGQGFHLSEPLTVQELEELSAWAGRCTG